MPKKRVSKRYKLANPSHRDAVAPAEIELLHTRALLAVRNFTHYEGGDQARALMERLFRDYQRYPEEVHQRLTEAFRHIREQDPEGKLKEKISQAVVEINAAAKKIGLQKSWKKKRKKQ